LRVAPTWFELLAWVALGLGFASALVIAADIVVLGNRQHMTIMDVAFPLTALYLGPIALWAYFARGGRSTAGCCGTGSRSRWRLFEDR